MSEVKVNKISPRTNCGTVQLGDSGDTITIPAGATISNSGTASGFGSTGEVSWNTTKVTSGFTATSGVGYFADTSGGAFTITLPASPSAGNVVAISDYNGSFATNALTVGRNSSNINGDASDLDLNKSNTTTQFIYVDATEGWRVVFTGSLSDVNATFISATGGTITTSGDFKIHTFTGPGTFAVSSISSCVTNNVVDYLVIGGGGGGGSGDGAGAYDAGGAGAGGYRESSGNSGSYTASPLATPTGITVTATSFPITVDGGGAGSTYTGSPSVPAGTPGGASVFSTISSAGGGGGGSRNTPSGTPLGGQPGGSGGGAGQADTCAQSQYFGTGNTPPVSPPQGNNGGRSAFPVGGPGDSGGGGGGGAGAAGGNASCGAIGGNGAPGVASSITGSPVTRAGGGGGAGTPASGGTAGPGGGGTGSGPGQATTAGTANTGGGGGAGSGASCRSGGNGGSGLVVIRYKFQ